MNAYEKLMCGTIDETPAAFQSGCARNAEMIYEI
jgi:hypothetical protein